MDSLLQLAERCEAAEASEQRQWLEQAFYALNPAPEGYGKVRVPWVDLSNRFRRKLDAEAYESAAMMLVPEGHRVCLKTHEDGRAAAWVWHRLTHVPSTQWGDYHATPALALAAASLRARHSQGVSDNG